MANVGRPSKYDPKFCQTVVEAGEKGKSITQMALACGVCKNTLSDWASEHPEFSIAFTRAKMLSMDWWESVAQTHMIEEPGASKLNTGVWSRSMAARFPDEYTEKKQTELTGANGGPIQGINVTFVDPASE